MSARPNLWVVRIFTAVVMTAAVFAHVWALANGFSKLDPNQVVLLLALMLVAIPAQGSLLWRGAGAGRAFCVCVMPVWVASIMALGPQEAVIIASVSTLISQVFIERSPNRFFNLAVTVVSVAVAGLAFELISPHGLTDGLVVFATAGVVAAALIDGLSFVITAVSIQIEGQGQFRDMLESASQVWVSDWVGQASTGLTAGIIGSAFPIALPLLTAPAVLIIRAAGSRGQANLDRARLNHLVQAAIRAQKADSLDSARKNITDAVEYLLSCGHVEFRHEPPLRGQLGVPVWSVRGQQWLVVDRAQGISAHEDDDRKLLEALAAVAAGAFDHLAVLEQAHYQATHDSLTGLANRVLLEEELADALVRGNVDGESLALAFVDLDRFKSVNDSFGHEAGDDLLIQVSDRLKTIGRASDTVARFGGDEFVILLRGFDGYQQLQSAVDRLMGVFDEPFELDGNVVKQTPSVGIACYPQDGLTADELLTRADAAMYDAKRMRPGLYKFASKLIDEVIR